MYGQMTEGLRSAIESNEVVEIGEEDLFAFG